jgi:hypothetical protein
VPSWLGNHCLGIEEDRMNRVIIGMDPHKRSATIEVMAGDESVLGGGKFATDACGHRAMLAAARRWPERTWAAGGCQGIGRHIANRLLAAGEQVVDVPAKLSARTRVFATGQGRKTDATDAHSVALAATRMSGLREVVDDQQLAVLRILADRRRPLGEDHTRMVSPLHQLLLELIPGGAKKDLSAAQAKVLLARVRPRDAAGKARRRVAAELISDLERIYQRKKEANKELTALLAAAGTTLTDLHGMSHTGFVGGYDALASGMIIVWAWPISQSFSYSAGGILPQAEWSLSLLYQDTHSAVATVTSPASCHGPSKLISSFLYREFTASAAALS